MKKMYLCVFAVIVMTVTSVVMPAFASSQEIVAETAMERSFEQEYVTDFVEKPSVVADFVERPAVVADFVERPAVVADFVERPAVAEIEHNFYFDGNGVAYQYVREVEVTATAYCHCEKCCGKTPDHEAYGITKSGVDLLAPGADIRVIAADPSVLPLGTKIYIEVPEDQRDTMYVTADYGFASVEDTGGAIDGNRIDVYFPTHQEACEWGIRYVKVHVIVPVE